MTDTINDVAAKKKQEPVVPVLDEQSVAEQLVAQARAQGHRSGRPRTGC